MSKELIDRLKPYIPSGDGHNSQYANDLADAVAILEAKAAPVGEREAFEAWLDTLPDATGAIAMAKDEWDEQQARYFKRESCPDLNSAFAAFKAGAAYQRQVHAEHEGPDYGDGPEFEGWAERSAQQPQSAEVV